MPSLRPYLSNSEDLGSASQYWRRLYVGNIVTGSTISVNHSIGDSSKPFGSVWTNRLYLTNSQVASGSDGAFWKDFSDHVWVRSGGTNHNLSNAVVTGVNLSVSGSVLSLSLSRAVGANLSGFVGLPVSIATLTPGSGVSITGSATAKTIALDSGNMPTLLPVNLTQNLGSLSQRWETIFSKWTNTRRVILADKEAVGPIGIDGSIWQSDGHIYARTNGVTKNLSDIGLNTADPTTLTAGANGGISVTGSASAGYVLALNTGNIPSLLPINTSRVLGSSSQYWSEIYATQILPRGPTPDLGTSSSIWATVNTVSALLYSGSTFKGSLTGHSTGVTFAVDGNLTFAVNGSISGLPTSETPTVTLSAGAGISVTGSANSRTIALNVNNIPAIKPASTLQ